MTEATPTNPLAPREGEREALRRSRNLVDILEQEEVGRWPGLGKALMFSLGLVAVFAGVGAFFHLAQPAAKGSEQLACESTERIKREPEIAAALNLWRQEPKLSRADIDARLKAAERDVVRAAALACVARAGH